MNQIIFAGKHLLTCSVSRHTHSNWEFLYCTSGSGALEFDRLRLPYQEGDVILIPPGFPHSKHSPAGFTGYYIAMAEPALSLGEPTVMPDGPERSLQGVFSGAYFQYGSSPEEPTPLLGAWAELLVLMLSARLASPQRSFVVEQIEGCIIQNYPDSSFELDSYLRTLPFSYDYLRKLFQKEMGVTPHRYLVDKRLHAAAAALSGGHANGGSVSEIANQCGFREPLYFSRVFRSRYGVSPSQYRRAARA